MPVVSQRNAIFMENEINGIHVEDWIIEKFAGLDRAQGEELGLAISLEMAKAALPYADGLYLMSPLQPGGPDGAADRQIEAGSSRSILTKRRKKRYILCINAMKKSAHRGQLSREPGQVKAGKDAAVCCRF